MLESITSDQAERSKRENNFPTSGASHKYLKKLAFRAEPLGDIYLTYSYSYLLFTWGSESR